jgi:hypothetical protein
VENKIIPYVAQIKNPESVKIVTKIEALNVVTSPTYMAAGYTLYVYDALAITEIINNEIVFFESFSPNETASLSEDFTTLLTVANNESIELTDSLNYSISVALDENLNMSDSLFSGASEYRPVRIADTPAIIDNIDFEIIESIPTELVTITDAGKLYTFWFAELGYAEAGYMDQLNTF